MSPPARFCVLGTAGHIDHGKTSLVRRLTGIDTDRLPEEKQRGITIDLGFANLDLPGARIGIVDVPGHERFVHNMVAGATGVDLALLVVAADDSVMPQTVEHLAILDLLGVRQGLVAITKCDLVDPDHLEFVREELSDLLAGTFLEKAPTVAVSSVTGEGIERLRDELGRLADSFPRTVARSVFRMPIDRVFSIAGHGTVVTGTVHGGRVRVGDSLEVMPLGRAVRVRRLQSHQSDLEEIGAGQRAAINLHGVRTEDLRRGDELAAAGYLAPGRRMLASVRLLKSAARPLGNRKLVRLHLGTQETTVRVILRGEPLPPGGQAFLELRSSDPMLADHGQRFILRQLSPAVTIGGGVVLDPAIAPHRRIRDHGEIGARLARENPLERLAAYLEEKDVHELGPHDAVRHLGIESGELEGLLERLTKDRVLLRLGGPRGRLIHRRRRDALYEEILKRLKRELKRRAPAVSLEPATLVSACRRLAEPATLSALIEDMIAQGKLIPYGERIGPPRGESTLTRNQQKIQASLVEACAAGGLAPPTIGELAGTLATTAKELERIARVSVDEGKLVHVGESLYFAPEAIERARRTLVEHLSTHPSATVADLRQLWAHSRKYAVPLCEHFDALGVTVRKGDQRALGPAAKERGASSAKETAP